MSSSLRHHGLQHTMLPCPTLPPRVCSNSCLLSQYCHPTISSSVTPFSSHRQSFPPSGSFPMSWLFSSGGQSTGASSSASVLPMNIQSWVPLRLTGLISLLSKGLSKSSLAPQFKSMSSLAICLPYGPTLTSIHDYWSGFLFSPTGYLPNPGINLMSPVSLKLACEFFTTEPPGKP